MAATKEIQVLLKRYEGAKSGRDQIRPLFEELGKYIWPAMQDMIIDVDIPDEGLIRTVDIYDSTAMKSATKMTSGVFSYLMPLGSKWFIFEGENEEENREPENKLWLSKATVETHKRIWRSNYLREMWSNVKFLLSFGNACISYEKKKDFKTHPIQTIFFEESSSGLVDVVFRDIFYDKRQALQEFDNPGKTVEAEEDGSTKKYKFIHCVFPNADYDEKYGSKKFASVYINETDQVEVYQKGKKRGGYDRQFYKVARMPKGPSGIHGEAPGKDMLPDIKMLNSIQESFAKAVEATADPTLVVSDDGVVGQPITGGGGLVVMRAGAEKPYILSQNADLNAIAAYIASKQEDIKEGFYNKIFTPLEDQQNMTATEVDERVSEGLTLAAPLITPLNKEILDPLFLQVLNDIPEDDLPPKPEGLELKIVYQGRLALAMGKLQASAGERWVAKWSPLEELRPVLDNVDIDKIARDSALNEGVPAENIVPVEIRDAGRAQKAQQAQIVQGADIAETASKAYKNVQGATGG